MFTGNVFLPVAGLKLVSGKYIRVANRSVSAINALCWDRATCEGGRINGVILLECSLIVGHRSVNPRGWYGFLNLLI